MTELLKRGISPGLGRGISPGLGRGFSPLMDLKVLLSWTSRFSSHGPQGVPQGGHVVYLRVVTWCTSGWYIGGMYCTQGGMYCTQGEKGALCAEG